MTMTLPVKISSIIWAKFLNALAYIFFGMIVACVAFAIEADLYQVLPYIFNADAWHELFGILGEIPGQVYLVMVNYVIIGILGMACPILLAYLSMSLTQLAVAGKYRTAIACVVFVVLSIALGSGLRAFVYEFAVGAGCICCLRIRQVLLLAMRLISQ